MKKYYEGIDFEVGNSPKSGACGFCGYLGKCINIIIEGKTLSWICNELTEANEYLVSYGTENNAQKDIQRFCETQCMQDCEGCILKKYKKGN